jgi:phosphomannomutase
MVSVSGVRGTIGKTLTPMTACEFGVAFGTMLGPGSKVVIGRDTRPSGEMIRDAVTAGLLSTGVHVVLLGTVTTPGAALMTDRLDADGGVIITASHNPEAYNGIKFLQPSGVGLTAAQAGRLKALWEGQKFRYAGSMEQGLRSENHRTHGHHLNAVLDTVDVEAIKKRQFRVVLDSINGAGCVVTPMLLGALGCEYRHLNGKPTGRFAHEPEPIEPNLRGLCDAVRESGAHVGFAQDPDADRLVIVDETGTFIGEEYTLALCAAQVLRHRKGKLAANLATSRMIDDLAADAGVEVVRAPTGEANVVEAMQREGCLFGGEGNGGVIDPRVVSVRDSLVGIAMILQYLTETDQPLSALVEKIPRYTLVKTKLPCPADAAAEVATRTREAFADTPGARFDEADGLRVDIPDAWVSVRASNTEPIMRIFAEAPTADQADQLVARVRAIADEVIAGG